MAVVRTHRYTIDAANLDAMLDQRATVIHGIRSANSALTNTRLVRLDDGTYLDVWTWESADAMHAAAEAAKNFPLVGATFSLLEDHVIVDGDVVDER